MKIAVVGATGLVGREMLRVLEERDLPIDELYLVASNASKGKIIRFKGKSLKVICVEDLPADIDLALFSAGSEFSLKWGKVLAARGCFVVDNSSAWRMNSDVPLVIPEINSDTLKPDKRLIANPNCSTIQLLITLAPLHFKLGIRRVVVSTYQSVSGSGYKALSQLEAEAKEAEGAKAYPWPIYKNCIPHCDVFLENDYTREEMKLVNETHKILDPDIAVTATAVRVPVDGGHSESVNLELKKAFKIQDIHQILAQAKGLVVMDNPSKNEYPMPLYSKGRDEVFVGRIRTDSTIENGLNLWITADNLRKGAATNAVQIAQALIEKGFIPS